MVVKVGSECLAIDGIGAVVNTGLHFGVEGVNGGRGVNSGDGHLCGIELHLGTILHSVAVSAGLEAIGLCVAPRGIATGVDGRCAQVLLLQRSAAAIYFHDSLGGAAAQYHICQQALHL